MSFATLARAATAATLFASSASAAYSSGSTNNVAVYWGQGAGQQDLIDVCNDSSFDIVNLAFVNGFPLKRGDYPKTNFGKHILQITRVSKILPCTYMGQENVQHDAESAEDIGLFVSCTAGYTLLMSDRQCMLGRPLRTPNGLLPERKTPEDLPRHCPRYCQVPREWQEGFAIARWRRAHGLLPAFRGRCQLLCRVSRRRLRT
jgi:hypothetical protein